MGLFDKMKQADIHVWLDHVALSKGDYVNRTQIQQPDGRPMWLTIPVEKGKPINQTRVMDQKWKWKHRVALSQAYPNNTIHVVAGQWLHPILTLTMVQLRAMLGVNAVQVDSSALGGASLGSGSELILNLCKEVGADVYLSGPHGRDYLDLPSFEEAGIEVRWHDFPVVQPVLSAVHDLFGRERVPA